MPTQHLQALPGQLLRKAWESSASWLQPAGLQAEAQALTMALLQSAYSSGARRQPVYRTRGRQRLRPSSPTASAAVAVHAAA